MQYPVRIQVVSKTLPEPSNILLEPTQVDSRTLPEPNNILLEPR